MSFFKQLSAKKRSEYGKSDIIIADNTSMSLVASPLDLPDQLRATLLIPMIDLSVVAKHMIDLTRCFTETLVDFVCFSPVMALEKFGESLDEVGTIAYFAMSAVTDTISALITLGTKTLGAVATVASLALLAVGIAVLLPLYACAVTLKAAYSLGCTALGYNDSLVETNEKQFPAPN